MTPVLQARQVRKVFRGGDGSTLEVLRAVDLEVAEGESVAIVGESGAGKSTLLHMLGALDAPTEGEILLDGRTYGGLDDGERDALRGRAVGFVFQFHHLLRDFTVVENVMMPLLIGGTPRADAHTAAADVLSRVGLEARLAHRPTQLSGGEQQRCAVARALVHQPRVLLADEPSGNLDRAHSDALHDLVLGLVEELGMTLVVVTHNPALANRTDRVLELRDGLLAQNHGSEGEA
jgi:lipoprotein-releasing system ATP-binding protein